MGRNLLQSPQGVKQMFCWCSLINGIVYIYTAQIKPKAYNLREQQTLTGDIIIQQI